jgi:hypothetical protein
METVKAIIPEVKQLVTEGFSALRLDTGALGGFHESEISVLGESVKHVPPLQSDDPTDIFRFFVDVKGIYDLQLASDRTFMVKLLPRVKGACLTLLGGLLGEAILGSCAKKDDSR